MNINLVTSFLIGGTLLLMLARMNISVGQSATEVAISGNKQMLKSDIQEVVSYDFPKIGYDFSNSITTPIVSADSSSITFRSNLDNSPDSTVETIVWEFTSNEVTSTPNPNDYVLTRSVDGAAQEIIAGVTKFKLNYYDDLGDDVPLSIPLSASDISSIRQIEVVLELQSAEAISTFGNTDQNYIITIWSKRFTPRNLSVNL